MIKAKKTALRFNFSKLHFLYNYVLFKAVYTTFFTIFSQTKHPGIINSLIFVFLQSVSSRFLNLS
jgi:hypothetical protein